MSPVASTRWCPTPEQLMILEELYRNGVRTPNAPQIQRITAHLSLYGKIEGKNVFYWFQNHKARDRQKLRKKLIKQLQQQQAPPVQFPCDHHLQCHISQANHHLLLNYFDPLPVPLPPPPPHVSTSSPSFCHLSSYLSSPPFPHPPHQVGIEGAPRTMEDPNTTMRSSSTCGHDWGMMMMEDVGPPFSTISSPTRTLKTLELFPITASNLKEECNPKHLSCRLTSTG